MQDINLTPGAYYAKVQILHECLIIELHKKMNYIYGNMNYNTNTFET